MKAIQKVKIINIFHHGNFRTTDLNYSVSKVGDELNSNLVKYGFNVNHNTTFHDFPAYTGSYGRSLKTVSGILSQNKDTDVVIDLHRDAIGDDSYAPKVKIGNEYAAQIMFVIGTNGSGLAHDNWQQNLQFAMKVQQKANELYEYFKKMCSKELERNIQSGVFGADMKVELLNDGPVTIILDSEEIN